MIRGCQDDELLLGSRLLMINLDFVVLFKFVWSERVLAIIISAKVWMKSYLPLLQESNLNVSHSRDSIFYVENEDFRSKDPEWIFWTHTSCTLIYFDTLSPLSPVKVQFIFQLVKVAHKIQNCFFIINILSFHYFCFWAILTISYWAVQEVMSPKILVSLQSHSVIYCLELYPLSKVVVDLLFDIINRILLYPESSAAVHNDHVYNTSDSFHVWYSRL